MGNAYYFDYSVHANFPKLGWGLALKENSMKVEVHVGELVEIRENFFVAGVWDGIFQEGNFDKAEFFCGTGVKICEGVLEVCSPSHERERIVYVQNQKGLFISNSIPLVLALSGEKIDINYTKYEQKLSSIINGLKEYIRDIPLSNKAVLHQVFCADIYVKHARALEIVERKKHRDFQNYDDYYNSLINVSMKIRDNGADQNRKHTYGLVSTVSSGYDSSACAAVAYELGGRVACTFSGGKYDEDSGVPVAKQIGFQDVIVRDKNLYKRKDVYADVNSLYNGDVLGSLEFTAFEDIFRGNIVFMGMSGDTAYGKDVLANQELKRHDIPYYQSSLSYFGNAINEGYIILPMPMYALTAHKSILAITNAKEMEPWTLYNSYDRPIPRRIVETHGGRRESFGQAKYGGGFSGSKNFSKKQIKRKMTDEGYRAFVEWLSVKGNNDWSFKRIREMLKYHVATIPEYCRYVMSKLGVKIQIKKLNPYPNPGLPAKLIVWGIDFLTVEYKKAME